MDQQDRLRAQREGGNVTRCHNTPHIGTYTVGQHSFNMLLLLHELHPNPSLELARAILYHDIAERWTGDLPAPALLESPHLRDGIKMVEKECHAAMGTLPHITEDDERWLKSLDKLEHWLWCHDQLAMGNRHVESHKTKLDEIFASLTYHGDLPLEVADFIAQFVWKRGTDGLPGQEGRK